MAIDQFPKCSAVTLTTAPTPLLVVDGQKVRRNIERLADYCRHHGLRLRPHTKTHKSKRIAELQVAAGAYGLSVAKAGEAEVTRR